MILAVTILPGVLTRVSPPPDLSCLAPGRHVIRHPSREPSVLYQPSAAAADSAIPVISPERVNALEPYSNNPLVLPAPPVLLDWAYDYATHGLLTLAAPTALIGIPSEFVWIETVPLGPAENHRLVTRFGPWEGCGGGKDSEALGHGRPQPPWRPDVFARGDSNRQILGETSALTKKGDDGLYVRNLNRGRRRKDDHVAAELLGNGQTQPWLFQTVGLHAMNTRVEIAPRQHTLGVEQ